MELDDLAKRLLPFSQAHYNDKDIFVSNVTKMPGHAGFSYGFTVTTEIEKIVGTFVCLHQT